MRDHKSSSAVYLVAFLYSIILFPGLIASAGELQEGAVRFAVIGDRTGGHVPGVYSAIIREIELLKPDFVMTVGDMIEGYTDDTLKIMLEWDEYLKLLEPLTSDIHHTPGNHDIWSWYEKSLELYRRKIGDNYYSFDYKNLHIVVLDVSNLESVAKFPDDQTDWLINDLEKNKDAAYTFVFYHKPFWWETLGAGKSDRMHEIFKKYGVDAVFTGHFHNYFSAEYDGIKYTSVGSSGGGTQISPNGLQYHFVWITVDHRGISIAIIEKDSVRPWEDFTVKNLLAIDELQRSGVTFENSIAVTDDEPIRDATSILKVHNPSEGFSFKDTLRWEVPENWTVEPQVVSVDIQAGKEKTYVFKVGNNGVIYPIPKASLDFQYEKGKKYNASVGLKIAREAVCSKAERKPEIDGEVTDECWTDPVVGFYSQDGNVTTADSTCFYFAYDDENLYLAAVCLDTDISKLAAHAEGHDGAVYNEDCVGYFIQPDKDVDILYQLYFNPKGTVFDAKITQNEDGRWNVDREWNGEYEVKGIQEKKYWSIEICVPLVQINGEANSGMEWLINFRRKQKRLDATADWQIPIMGAQGVLEFK